MKALCARARARRAPHAWAGTAGDARPTPGLRLARMRGGRARAAQPGSAARARLAAGAPRGRSRRRPRRPRPAFPAAPALPALRPWPRAPPRQGLGLGNHKPPRADSLISRACVLGESRERRAQRVQSAAGAYTTWPPCARGMRQPCRPPARQRRAGPGARWRRGSLPKCNMACARACREVPKQAPPTGQGVTLDQCARGARRFWRSSSTRPRSQPGAARSARSATCWLMCAAWMGIVSCTCRSGGAGVNVRVLAGCAGCARRHVLAHLRHMNRDRVLHLPQRGRWRQREGLSRVCGQPAGRCTFTGVRSMAL